MTNVFDNLALLVVDTTTSLMGYDARWTPSTGGAQQAARVHFKDPSKDFKITDKAYSAATGIMEHKISEFIGLKSLLDQNKKETIAIDISGTATEFFAFKCELIHDGNLLKVYLQHK